ncbi:helicase protein [Ancylostoma duodenale]|uniref:Helicase protein n=1 Tax=Ancylostoma duodenale TaxID=51022 RepID=A0A0C2GWH3_9BILA|nr:helicase protein [Ancylostoma duodenale]
MDVIFQNERARPRSPSEIQMALELLESILDANEKCVIVSQWTSFLKLLEKHIMKRFPEVSCSTISGDVAPADRQSRVDRFNSRKGEIDIMLVSITAGGVGLNLTGGNHLILMDLHWNPALELQASDRVHRMGQTKDVYIHKLIMKNSIEERVLDLQKKKMELAESVLRGFVYYSDVTVKKRFPYHYFRAVSKKAMNLTLADLRFLFNLDGSS